MRPFNFLVNYLLLILLKLLLVHAGALEGGPDLGVRVQQVQHQLQGVPVHVHVEPVLREDKEDGGGTQGQT
mgnify:CR=1 FL=1